MRIVTKKECSEADSWLFNIAYDDVEKAYYRTIKFFRHENFDVYIGDNLTIIRNEELNIQIFFAATEFWKDGKFCFDNVEEFVYQTISNMPTVMLKEYIKKLSSEKIKKGENEIKNQFRKLLSLGNI